MVTKEYNIIAGKYTELIKKDGLKHYLQYPGLLKILGNVRHKSVLDIGCGNGFFSSMVAKQGAKIVGFDASKKQIELAKENEKNLKLGMEFFCSDQSKFQYSTKFDIAFSNMVIFYAEDIKQLTQFFKCAFGLLKDGKKFISAIINPEYLRFGELHYDRKIVKKGKKARTEFYISGKFNVSSGFYSLFSKKQYEIAAKNAGFVKTEWKTFELGKKKLGKEGSNFLKNYFEDPLYSVFIVRK